MDATIHRVEAGPCFHGLGMTYAVGLALLIVGSPLIPGAFVGLLGIPMLLAGTILIGIAVERLQGAPEAFRLKLLGGLLLIVGLLGTIPLAFLSAIMATPLPGPAGPEPPSWVTFVVLSAAWAAWPGLTCAGVWLRRRPAPQAILVLWLSLGASYAAITAISSAIFPYLPRSL